VSGMGTQNKEHQPPPLGFGWTAAIYGAARTARGRRPDVMLTGGSPATCGDNGQEKKGDQSMCTTREGGEHFVLAVRQEFQRCYRPVFPNLAQIDLFLRSKAMRRLFLRHICLSRKNACGAFPAPNY
jgi:hypothetical protein